MKYKDKCLNQSSFIEIIDSCTPAGVAAAAAGSCNSDFQSEVAVKVGIHQIENTTADSDS